MWGSQSEAFTDASSPYSVTVFQPRVVIAAVYDKIGPPRQKIEVLRRASGILNPGARLLKTAARKGRQREKSCFVFFTTYQYNKD